jgi:hypothetical protein
MGKDITNMSKVTMSDRLQIVDKKKTMMWLHEKVGKLGSGGLLYRYKRYGGEREEPARLG